MGKSQIKHTLQVICHRLPENGINFLLIGGFAINYYGYTRSTLDLDFMIVMESQGRLLEVMKKSGYSNFSSHRNVVFFQQPGTALRLDFLKVDQETFTQLFSRSQSVEIGGSKLRIPCLQDLLAMKLFTVEHGSELRGDKDLEDVVQLSLANSLEPASDLEPLCRQYASEKVYEKLCARLGQHRKH